MDAKIMIEALLYILSLIKGGKHHPAPDAPNWVLRCEGMSIVEQPTKHRKFAVIMYERYMDVVKDKAARTVGRGKTAGTIYASGFGRYSESLGEYVLTLLVHKTKAIEVRYFEKVPTSNIITYEFPHHENYSYAKTSKEIAAELELLEK